MTAAPMPSASGRLIYLDQFRGYTVAGMILVNYIGYFGDAIPAVLRHHNTYCSYADTIMPQFFLAVGFALRFTFMKRLQEVGWMAAQTRVLRRVLALLLIAMLVHGFDRVQGSWDTLTNQGLWAWLVQIGQRSYFQTLTHIAVTTLWVLPVIAAPGWIRFLWLMASAALHLWISHMYWLEYVLKYRVIDGGPLGFLTWTIPVLMGTLASDWLTSDPNGRGRLKVLLVGLLLMLLGYLGACLTWGTNQDSLTSFRWVTPPLLTPENIKESPETVHLWTMSQRTGSITYQTFAAGFSLVVLWLCSYVFNERRQFALFRTLGSNALIAYIAHGLAIEAVTHALPRSSPWWVILAGFLTVLGITWLICRYLEKRGWYLRL